MAITWTLHPAFCHGLRDRFPEDIGIGPTFVNCEAVRQAITHGFDLWASNHPLLTFHDVTDMCHKQYKLSHDSATPWHCPLAEVHIENSGEAVKNYVAHVIHTDVTETRTTLTNGVTSPSLSPTIRSAVIRVSTLHCFYLDATFCTGINAAVGGSLGVFAVTLIEATLFFIVGCSGAYVLSIIYLVAKATRIGSKSSHAAAMAASATNNVGQGRASIAPPPASFGRRLAMATLDHAPMCYLLIAFFLLVMVPSILMVVVRPCKSCYDFESTMAHEIGHLLGFAHTDDASIKRTRGQLKSLSNRIHALLRRPLARRLHFGSNFQSRRSQGHAFDRSV